MNEHITDYLNKYLKLKNPGYAVFIKGEWGCGKTYFIKQYIEAQKDKKICYISLNGIKQCNDVIPQILLALAPKEFNSKICKGVISVGRTIAYGVTKFFNVNDVLNIGDLSSCVSGNIVFVFDDLERTLLEPKEILGFLSDLVEQQSFHVIIIGDETKFIEDNQEEYLSRKEKVIGKTLQIQSDDCEILPQIFEQIEYDNYRPLFQKYHKNIELIIKEILTVCDKNQTNYRIVKNSCREFIFAFNDIFADKDLSTRHNDFFYELFSRFVIISYCLQSGCIKYSELNNIFEIGFRYKDLPQEQIKVKKINEAFEEKILDSFLPVSQWLAIFNHQKIDNQRICALIKNRLNPHKPNWEQLWWYRDYEDDKIKTVFAAVEEDLRKFKYCTIPEIFHTFTTMLEMSKLYAIQHYTPQAVIEKAQKYLSELGELLEWDTVQPYITNINDFSSGYCFHAEEYKEYNQLLDLLKDAVKSKTQKNIDEQYQNLLNDIRNRSLTVNAIYQFADIYSNQSPSLLWEVLVNLDPKYFNRYCNLMVDHIVPHQLRNYRCTQQDFWQTILDKAKEYLASNKKQCKNVAKCIYIEKYFINDMESLCNANATQ